MRMMFERGRSKADDANANAMDSKREKEINFHGASTLFVRRRW